MSFKIKVTLTISIFFLLSIIILSKSYNEEDPRKNAIVKAVEKVSPAVVNISTEKVIVQRYDPFFGFGGGLFYDPEDFFGRHYYRKFKAKSLGSGVIIDEDGYILTNEHIISRAY